MTSREAWLEGHTFLQPLARLCAKVEQAAAGIERPRAPIPRWDDYRNDFLAGVPLLQSTDVGLDLDPAGKMTAALVAKLASEPLEGTLVADARALDAQLRGDPDAASRIAAWLLGDDTFTPAAPGLLRFVAWTAAARYLGPVVATFESWRDDEKWLRAYCPTCGSLPAMAQLVGVDPGRKRLLACGCCASRWQFERMGCPFCEREAQKITAVTIEGEGRLRIDYCEACRGYLKTYNGQGEEATFLSDWTSLHIDVLARDRGLKRLAASLYDLDSVA